MPRFFDIKNLSELQKINWDKSVVNYKNIINNNINNLPLTFFMDNCANEKSALFYRLLEGKKSLKFPPPLSFSYPWYEVIESFNPIEIFINQEIGSIKDLINNNMIDIHQSRWKVINKKSNNEVYITHHNWEILGFVWKLSIDYISCKETSGFMISHHNLSLGRIHTLSQFIEEKRFQLKLLLNNIMLAQDETLFEEEKNKLLLQYGILGNSIAQSKKDYGLNIIEKRKKNGLSVYPTTQEIEEEVEKNVKSSLDSEFIVKDGELFQRNLILQKIQFIDDIYNN